jgi:lipoprotein-anchoring transpeptidase ErfK/SrfK
MLKLLLIGGIIASTPVAHLHANKPVHVRPDGAIVKMVKAREPATGEPTVLPIIAERDVNHRTWLHVRLPYRPNGASGWISTTSITLSTIKWAVYIDRSQRIAHIYLSGKLVRSYRVIVGRPSLPTPIGDFFVTEVMAEPGEVTGPYALATSAYSDVLQEFDGGPGQVALHGREGLPEPIGSASSHGCVRFDNSAITWLAQHLEAGTPVIIR